MKEKYIKFFERYWLKDYSDAYLNRDSKQFTFEDLKAMCDRNMQAAALLKASTKLFDGTNSLDDYLHRSPDRIIERIVRLQFRKEAITHLCALAYSIRSQKQDMKPLYGTLVSLINQKAKDNGEYFENYCQKQSKKAYGLLGEEIDKNLKNERVIELYDSVNKLFLGLNKYLFPENAMEILCRIVEESCTNSQLKVGGQEDKIDCLKYIRKHLRDYAQRVRDNISIAATSKERKERGKKVLEYADKIETVIGEFLKPFIEEKREQLKKYNQDWENSILI